MTYCSKSFDQWILQKFTTYMIYILLFPTLSLWKKKKKKEEDEEEEEEEKKKIKKKLVPFNNSSGAKNPFAATPATKSSLIQSVWRTPLQGYVALP
jgi:hypothetical protein